MAPDPQTSYENARAALAGSRYGQVLDIVGPLAEAAPTAEAWYLIGAARYGLASHSEALQAFDRALELQPGHRGADNGAAAALAALGRLAEAAGRLQARLARSPGEADTWANLALVELGMARPARALEATDRALGQAPDHLAAWAARGQALLALLRPAEAASAFARCCELAPDAATHWFNLGEAELAADDYAAACQAYEAGLRREGAAGLPRVGRAIALAMDGRHDEADREFAALEAGQPEALRDYFANMARAAGVAVPAEWRPSAREIHAARLARRVEACDWAAEEPACALFRELAAQATGNGTLHDRGLLLHALHLPLGQVAHAVIADGISRAIRTAHPPRPVARRRPAGSRIRIGVVTPSVRDHPSAQIQWRRMALHDRARFEVFVYALTEPDDSELARRFQQSCDVFRNMAGANADAIAWRVARDGIDLLMDVSGHFDFSRPEIFALRPAPVSLSYLGTPASLGAGLVDYRISDALCTPDALRPGWAESVIRLPGTHFIYNDREPIAPEAPRRSDWGLPEAGPVLACFNSAAKYDRESFAAWMAVLARLPGAVLWLLDPGDPARQRLLGAAGKAGVDGRRLVFAQRIPRPRHLARLRCADLFVDTFRYGAHTTAADALWAGLPVLTRLGDTMASRLTGSIVAAAGLGDLAVADTATFVATAADIAGNADALAELRRRLAAGRDGCPLFDTAGRVRDLERAMIQVMDRHRRGLPPASFDLDSAPTP